MYRDVRLSDYPHGTALSAGVIGSSLLAIAGYLLFAFGTSGLVVRGADGLWVYSHDAIGSVGNPGDPLLMILAIAAPALTRLRRYSKFPSVAEYGVATAVALLSVYALISAGTIRIFVTILSSWNLPLLAVIIGVSGAIAGYAILFLVQRERRAAAQGH